MTEIQEEIISLRREIHRFPELSNEEKETAKRIVQFLKSCDPDEVVTGIGGTGIVARFKGNMPGERVMFRAELDALPIHEINDLPYSSEFPNVGHKCGHDGHMAILCDLARKLSRERDFNGEVLLLFQPAEEVGLGANEMLQDPKFKDIKSDYIFALHNLPGYPLGQVVCKPGAFSAAVETLIADITGKTAHAAEPEKGLNPAMAMSKVIEAALLEQNFTSENDQYLIVTPVHFNLGSHAYGTSAGEAHMAFTLRADETKRKDALSQRVENLIKEICKEEKLNVKFERREVFSAIMNKEDMVEIIRNAASMTGLKYEDKRKPFRWGEDFGLFTDNFKGAMFGIGAGENLPALHNPDYDFPDELIPLGSQMFMSIIHQILKK